MDKRVVEAFKTEGAVAMANTLSHRVAFLRDQVDLLYDRYDNIRPWHFWELHNPWSRSAVIMNSWKFLDICQSPELLNQIKHFIGENIILYDSQFYPDLSGIKNLKDHWNTDAERCPVEPLEGLAVRIPLKSSGKTPFKFLTGSHRDKVDKAPEQVITAQPDEMICHDIRIRYQIPNQKNFKSPAQYVIRYFPATSHYLRDPSARVHRKLAELYPLLNYAKMPLWLVSGEDKAENDFVTGFNPKAGRWIAKGK